jgi:F-type H+-transporting ATPase subunit c
MSLIKKSEICLYTAFLFIVSSPVIAGDENSALLIQNYGYFAMASAFCISLTAGVGALSQSMTARTALSGIARNPEAAGKIFVPMILSLALMESLVLFSLVVAFLIIGKIA